MELRVLTDSRQTDNSRGKVTLFNKEKETGARVSFIPERLPFIEANTNSATLSHLQHDCIIPVFSKDNESTISHHQFIGEVYACVKEYFKIPKAPIDIRVSHVVKGRIPSAIGKPAAELKDFEKTVYYERMAFTIEIQSEIAQVAGNILHLTVGGVRAYNHENLYGKKTMERFKVFIGFKNTVCTNLCISTDGYKAEVRASNLQDLRTGVLHMLDTYNRKQHIEQLTTLQEYKLTENQFAQLLGKSRLYQFLPPIGRKDIPELAFNDSHVGCIAKEYYQDANFRVSEDGTIDLWRLYNLFTGANKSSYIDSFLHRSVNAFEFASGIKQSIDGVGGYHWFLR